MDRERFVGVVISFSMDGTEPVDYVLESFVGEGNTSIVFGIAPRNDPQAKQWVVKFIKPDVRFEMTVLHYSFRIAEELYPNHPLLMTPDERMRRLTDEMLGRIGSEGSLFRLTAFRDMLMATIELLARQFGQDFRDGTLPAHWMSEIDSAIRPMIDDSLVMEIENMIDDDLFVDELRPFFEHIVDDIKGAIATAKQSGNFHPLSRTHLFKLLGLHLENFINWDELMAITDSNQFRPTITPSELSNFAHAVSILHYRTAGAKTVSEESSEDGRSTADAHFKEILSAAVAAARYMDTVAIKYHPDLPKWSAFAKNWHARTLLLEGKKDEAIALFEQVLSLPVTSESQPERHDSLLDLANLLNESEPDRADVYVKEALKIRRILEQP